MRPTSKIICPRRTTDQPDSDTDPATMMPVPIPGTAAIPPDAAPIPPSSLRYREMISPVSSDGDAAGYLDRNMPTDLTAGS